MYCCLLFFGCSLFSRSQQTNHSASPVKRYLRWVSWQTFQIVAVGNICAFLMSMASLYSLSPDFHPPSASLSSPERLEKLHYDAPRFYSRSCGTLSPVSIDDGAMGLKGERLACPGCPKGYGGQADCYIFLYSSISIFLFCYLFI